MQNEINPFISYAECILSYTKREKIFYLRPPPVRPPTAAPLLMDEPALLRVPILAPAPLRVGILVPTLLRVGIEGVDVVVVRVVPLKREELLMLLPLRILFPALALTLGRTSERFMFTVVLGCVSGRVTFMLVFGRVSGRVTLVFVFTFTLRFMLTLVFTLRFTLLLLLKFPLVRGAISFPLPGRGAAPRYTPLGAGAPPRGPMFRAGGGGAILSLLGAIGRKKCPPV